MINAKRRIGEREKEYPRVFNFSTQSELHFNFKGIKLNKKVYILKDYLSFMEVLQKGLHGKYTLKSNPKRFFYPKEWIKFYDSLKSHYKFHFDFLFNTGMRYNEAKHIIVSDIDFSRKWIVITKAKGGRSRIRYVHFTKEFGKRIKSYIDLYNLSSDDDFKFPTIQCITQILKRHCKLIGIKDWQNFSAHNIRKTHENYLLAIDKNIMHIQGHMGHTIQIAEAHYVSGALIKDEIEKRMIKNWFGEMFI